MERWQDRELKLSHSRVVHSKKDQALLKDAEHQLNLRGKLSEKQELSIRLSELYNISSSENVFYEKIKKSGLNLYFRYGEAAGITAKRKYRFRTLGFSRERIAELNREKEPSSSDCNTSMKKNMKLNTIKM